MNKKVCRQHTLLGYINQTDTYHNIQTSERITMADNQNWSLLKSLLG